MEKENQRLQKFERKGDKKGPAQERESRGDLSSGSVSADTPCGLVEAIRHMPDLEPPPDLLASVMGTVRARQWPWWYRARRWALAPKSVSFTPLQLAPLLILLLLLPSYYLFKTISPPLTPSNFQDRVPVLFSLDLSDARSVQVMGSFNNWQPQNLERRTIDGRETWAVTVSLSAGRYEYAFLVDGKTILPDPQARFYQDDGFGNRNNVLLVGFKDEMAI